ncbi:hypothetical protein C7M84_025369 [Penaeus vannamei]|uniref:Uncharacterized protein n=1 Tax=Penaeus vannamei TaxID=6689 RepID=A0A3R7PC18_PENVA|nr:hypothetical protein C7M84_025369 [Penaeus vannamei]
MGRRTGRRGPRALLKGRGKDAALEMTSRSPPNPPDPFLSSGDPALVLPVQPSRSPSLLNLTDSFPASCLIYLICPVLPFAVRHNSAPVSLAVRPLGPVFPSRVDHSTRFPLSRSAHSARFSLRGPPTSAPAFPSESAHSARFPSRFRPLSRFPFAVRPPTRPRFPFCGPPTSARGFPFAGRPLSHGFPSRSAHSARFPFASAHSCPVSLSRVRPLGHPVSLRRFRHSTPVSLCAVPPTRDPVSFAVRPLKPGFPFDRSPHSARLSFRGPAPLSPVSLSRSGPTRNPCFPSRSPPLGPVSLRGRPLLARFPSRSCPTHPRFLPRVRPLSPVFPSRSAHSARFPFRNGPPTRPGFPFSWSATRVRIFPSRCAHFKPVSLRASRPTSARCSLSQGRRPLTPGVFPFAVRPDSARFPFAVRPTFSPVSLRGPAHSAGDPSRFHPCPLGPISLRGPPHSARFPFASAHSAPVSPFRASASTQARLSLRGPAHFGPVSLSRVRPTQPGFPSRRGFPPRGGPHHSARFPLRSDPLSPVSHSRSAPLRRPVFPFAVRHSSRFPFAVAPTQPGFPSRPPHSGPAFSLTPVRHSARFPFAVRPHRVRLPFAVRLLSARFPIAVRGPPTRPGFPSRSTHSARFPFAGGGRGRPPWRTEEGGSGCNRVPG